MTAASARPSGLTLAIHPTSHGFGWIAFSGPFAPHDWSVVDVLRDKNAACLRKIEQLLGRLQPETLVLESYDQPQAKRSGRIVSLCRAIVALAIERSIEVAIYCRDDIRSCFATIGARTRQEIAQAVARHVEPLRPRVPRARRAWESDPKRMGLFSAAALVLTHYRLGASTLFNQL